MNAQKLREEVEDELLLLTPYIGSSSSLRYLPDTATILAALSPVVIAVFTGLLQAYGYDHLRPRIKARGLLPKDDAEKQIEELSALLADIKAQLNPRLDAVRQAVSESLKELSIPQERIEPITTAILEKVAKAQ
jgi:hypothetical protein